jgi:hypothetical protein
MIYRNELGKDWVVPKLIVGMTFEDNLSRLRAKAAG